ncbi:hypothetical protein BHK69_06035 [Bosea vaviloviae]|uniref:Uncharacterized protein n=1 Tax=Bosea vaviloviae TaxID=1526658 RepID=A0A1D7TY98_9HYPH|nr:hypothetical protein BHK69_06035 [Bosea vaviloviae]
MGCDNANVSGPHRQVYDQSTARFYAGQYELSASRDASVAKQHDIPVPAMTLPARFDHNRS